DVGGDDVARAGVADPPHPAAELHTVACAPGHAVRWGLRGDLDGFGWPVAGVEAGFVAIVRVRHGHAADRCGVAVLAFQTKVSQSLPRAHGTRRVWHGCGSRRASFRAEAWNVVRRFLLGVNGGPDAAAQGPHRRDGSGVFSDFQRTAGAADAAFLAMA